LEIFTPSDLTWYKEKACAKKLRIGWLCLSV
jgi:hypothetical protein